MPEMKTWTANGQVYEIVDAKAREHIANTSNPHGVTPAQIGAPNSITRAVYDTWFEFKIVGDGVANASSYERVPVTIIITSQNGQIINAQFVASTIDGHPLGSCFISSSMNMGISTIAYETVGTETRYSVSLSGVTHAYATAQITIPSTSKMTLGSYSGSYGTTSVLSVQKPAPDTVNAAPASGFEGYHNCANVDELNAKIDELTQAQPTGTEKTYYLYIYWYANAPLPCGRWSVTIHKPQTLTNWAGVTATVVGSQVIHKLCREWYEGTWLDWEWENPPMVLGVEYRTTERWSGKAVYTKLVDCGVLPNATQKSVAHGCNASDIIRCYGQMITTGESIPMHYDGKSILVYASQSNIWITANYDASGQKAYVQIWYTKK